MNIGLQACARAEDDGPLEAAPRRRRVGLQDPRGLRRLPRAHRSRPAVRRRPRRVGRAPHRRPPRVARSSRTRSRPSPAGRSTRTTWRAPAAAIVPDLLGLVREPNDHLLVDDADAAVSASPHRGRAPRDDAPQPRRVVGGAAATSSWHGNGSTRRRWRPKGRSTSSGAIPIVNSDSQGMGRIGETVRRTFQLAHVMKAWRRRPRRTACRGLPDETGTPATTTNGSCATSPRSRSSRRSPTASPTTSGRCSRDGSRTSSSGSPALFGVKPELVLQGRLPAWGPLGEGNATVERAEPTRYRADWGGLAAAAADVSADVRLAARRRPRPRAPARDASPPRRRSGCRGLTRADLCAQPRDRPDRDRSGATAGSRSDGRPLAVDPVRRGPAHAAATCCADSARRSAQMSPTVKPSGNGSLGSTT